MPLYKSTVERIIEAWKQSVIVTQLDYAYSDLLSLPERNIVSCSLTPLQDV